MPTNFGFPELRSALLKKIDYKPAFKPVVDSEIVLGKIVSLRFQTQQWGFLLCLKANLENSNDNNIYINAKIPEKIREAGELLQAADIPYGLEELAELSEDKVSEILNKAVGRWVEISQVPKSFTKKDGEVVNYVPGTDIEFPF